MDCHTAYNINHVSAAGLSFAVADAGLCIKMDGH